jgi:hypothetical protein
VSDIRTSRAIRAGNILSQPLQSLAATKLCTAINSEGVGRPAFSQEENYMADDMEKKGQQGNQGGQSDPQHKEGHQGGQPGQGQQSGQSGQYQPKKGGQGQSDEEDENRDRQRRAS